ncbi:MFS transporter [Kribbella albertanoniae]|uniref:MFS transporter n=1 Tax=Kribbella albertanoniae TaxID=1266829 RepID=A0A4R4QHS1_9ACTN|nr:MFS transporter [Kribbella albertanoniae]TDC35291.1 MFS transporter [Kribbella albertanoniae]
MTEPNPSQPSQRERLREFVRKSRAVQIIIAGYLVSSVGFGLYMSGSALYFVQSVGLSARQVGIGLAVAGGAGILLAVPIGQLSDRFGARNITLWLTGAQVALLIGATQVRAFGGFLIVIVLLGIAESGANVSRGALVASVVDRGDRVRLNAITRSLFNIGFMTGVALAGIAIGVGTRSAYLWVIVGNALTTTFGLVLYLFFPKGTVRPRRRRRWGLPQGLRDLPFLAVAQVSKLTSISDSLITVGIPLWIVAHTQAPPALAAWLIIINTAIVAVLQTTAARPSETLRGASRSLVASFALLVVACIVLSTTSALGPVWVIAGLVVVFLLLTGGEMLGSAASWAMRYELAPADAQGEYGGVSALGAIVPTALGPLLVTQLPDRAGGPGWLVLAAVFVVGLVLAVPVVRWAEKSRPWLQPPTTGSGG